MPRPLPFFRISKVIRSECYHAALAITLALMTTQDSQPLARQTPDQLDRPSSAAENQKPRAGSMNGIQVGIPEKYLVSSAITFASKGSSDIKYIIIELRRSNFEPIHTRQDFLDWQTNWLKPYTKSEPDHRWISVKLRADLYSMSEPNLKHLYDSIKAATIKIFPSLSCETVIYGLEHCVSKAEVDLLEINEIYFDKTNDATLITCRNQYSIKFKGCNHYFIVPHLRAVAEVGYSSDDEIIIWKRTEVNVKAVIDNYIIQ
jgi:hypothetical protein